MKQTDKLASTLKKYIPEAAVPIIIEWMHANPVQLKITRARATKLGDYRWPQHGSGHQISVNYNLNPYAFLVTLVHEFAHMYTWLKYKNQVQPHGIEWKKSFQDLMRPVYKLNVFPEDLRHPLVKYMQNPSASSCTDQDLMRALNKYDEQPPGHHTVESLPLHAVFALPNGRRFKKLEQLRKRFRCMELATEKMYLFSPLAQVVIPEQVEEDF